MSLSGKVAIITGATRGIGKSIAERYAQAGAKLILSARRKDALDRVADSLQNAGADVMVHPADMSDEKDIVGLVAAAAERFGRIDVLVNNAGFGIFKPVSQTKTEEFDALFNVNMRGSFHRHPSGTAVHDRTK